MEGMCWLVGWPEGCPVTPPEAADPPSAAPARLSGPPFVAGAQSHPPPSGPAAPAPPTPSAGGGGSDKGAASLHGRVGPSSAGNSRSADRVTTSELEVLFREHATAQHEPRARLERVLCKQLIGEHGRILPYPELEPGVEGSELRPEPRFAVKM